MKELKITELMREYTDDEFNIGGKNAADTEKVLENVMGRVKPEKKVKPLFKVLVAAAAAVAVLAGAVTAGTVLTGSYTTVTGRHVEWEYDYNENGFESGWTSSTTKELEDVLTLRDGRFYFDIDGESTDITDLIDRTTPYIYTYTLPESEKSAYVIAGGTAEEYAVVDLVYTEDTGWFGAGVINGNAPNSTVSIRIESNNSSSDEMKCYSGYYLSDTDFSVNYIIWDGDLRAVKSYGYGVTSFYPTWRDDADAWLIEALVQLELIELPKIENFVLPDIAVEDDAVTLWSKDITENISEEKGYVHRHIWNDAGYESAVIVGGTPGNFGWAFVEKRITENHDFEYWTIACDNITDADGQLREWYLNAAEKREYDLEQLRQNYYFAQDQTAFSF